MEITQSSAARPGPWSESLDSSFTVRAVSQPQKPKIDPDSPTMNAERVEAGRGEPGPAEVGADPGCLVLANAMIAKTSSTIIWKDTRMICTFSVASMPR